MPLRRKANRLNKSIDKMGECYYKRIYIDELDGSITQSFLCVLHWRPSRHEVGLGSRNPCLEIDPEIDGE